MFRTFLLALVVASTLLGQQGRNEAQAVFEEYCTACHNANARSGGVLIEPKMLGDIGANAETFEKIFRQLRSGAMPPPGMPRPEQAVYARMTGYLSQELERAASVKPNPGEVLPVHRLTRTEYKNAIRDLLDLKDLPKELDYVTLLPADNSSSGFDNLADTLFVSPVTMERYLDAARKIARLAMGDPDLGTLVNIHLTPVRVPQEMRNESLAFGTRGGTQVKGYFPQDGEYEFQIVTGGAVRGEAHQLEVSVDGERKNVSDITVAPRFDDPDAAPAVKVRLFVPAGPRNLAVAFLEKSDALSEAPLRPPGRSRGALPSVVSVTITGPFNPKGPGDTPSRRRILACKPASAAEEAPCARRVLSNLARLAYRRNTTDADLAPLMKFYEAGRADAGFDRGIERALERILVSPQFLFRIEREPAGAAPATTYRISDVELASRLSFFLWSSVPDAELLDAATSGKLKDPAALNQQVKRMLADPRSESLISNFAAQWLFLRDLDGKEPDLYLFRDFDEGLRAAFGRETELFLNSVLRENRSVIDLMTANYTYVNERLAKHYGIPNVTGSRFRRVELPAGSHRGGLLGQGSILSLTAYTTRTSPVLRGKYVLENLLASPPPPPPPNVPALKTEGSSGRQLSMREAMEQHRANPACASCHARMDPIGFALENYDAVAKWRDEDGGKPVDATAKMPDGTPVSGVEGVKQFVLKNPERFVEAVTNKLMMYGLGRNIQYYDEPTIRQIGRGAAKDNFTFSSLVQGVVSSPQFQMRQVRVPK